MTSQTCVDNSFVNKLSRKCFFKGQSKTVSVTVSRNSPPKERDRVFWRKTAGGLWLSKSVRMWTDLVMFLEAQWRE